MKASLISKDDKHSQALHTRTSLKSVLLPCDVCASEKLSSQLLSPTNPAVTWPRFSHLAQLFSDRHRNFADVRVLSACNLSLRQSVTAREMQAVPQEGGLEEYLVVCYFEGGNACLL